MSIHNLNNTHEYKVGSLAINNEQKDPNTGIGIKPSTAHANQTYIGRQKIQGHFPSKSVGINQLHMMNPQNTTNNVSFRQNLSHQDLGSQSQSPRQLAMFQTTK